MAGGVLWLLATCLLAIGELRSRRLALGSFALGTGAAAITDLAGATGPAPWLVFVGVSMLALGVVRPIARLRIEVAQIHPSTALVGREAIVLERIANREAVGCVEIDGEIWTARAFDEERVIERGTRVEVVEMKGATALVTE